jgi:ech hydrogenase subunit B
MEVWMTILKVVLFLVLAPFVGGLLSGFDRKISARLQGRQGPPLLQPFYDLAKLFNKQSLVVNKFQVFLICGYVLFTVFTGCLFFAGGDLLLAFFALTLGETFFMMAAFSANSPFSSMGVQRELVQTMCTEPMILIATIGFYRVTGSFMVSDIASTGMSPIAYLPGMFIGFLFILTIKLRKSPFDLSTSHHAHQEMVKGTTTDLTGNVYALIELSEWYEEVLLLAYVALFILNRNPWSILAAVVVCLLCYFLEILIDNVFPRVKWNAMFRSAWIVTLIFGGINLLATLFVDVIH